MGAKYPKSAQMGDEGVAVIRTIATAVGAIVPSRPPTSAFDVTLELNTDAREPSGDLVLAQIKTGHSHIRGGRFYVDATGPTSTAGRAMQCQSWA